MSRISNEIKFFSTHPYIWWGLKTPAGQKRYDNKYHLFFKLAKPQKNLQLLEIGCGYGEFTRRLAQTQCQITAIDITPKLLNIAKQSNWYQKSSTIKLQLMNAENPRLPKNSFDIICGVSILHHLNWQKTLRSLYKLLKPGGRIFFTEPNLFNPVVWAILNIGYLRTRTDTTKQETALIRWQIKSLLNKIGYRNISVKNYDFLYPKTPPYLINIIGQLSPVLEKIPLVKELSGSLMIYATR